MTALTDRTIRTAPRLGSTNRRLIAEQGRRLPSRLRTILDGTTESEFGFGWTAHRGSLLDALAPERA